MRMQNKLSYVQLYCFVKYDFQGEGVTGRHNPSICLWSQAVITYHLHFKHSQGKHWHQHFAITHALP